jgi:hypothetical protein
MGLPKYDLAVGLTKGHKTTKIDNPSKKRQSRRRGVIYFNMNILTSLNNDDVKVVYIPV